MSHQTTYRQELLALWGHVLAGNTGHEPRDVVLQELSEYFQLPVDVVRQRCLHWEQQSLEEWQAADRSTPQGLLDFYQTQTSWIFDTIWYHANQYEGTAHAESVDIAEAMQQVPPGRHLDFGAGPGTSSLFFHALGWQVSLADISTTFLDFARWRLARHAVPATFYDTSVEQLPEHTFDLITAFDVLVHVGDVPATLARLHSALAPGGYLVFNIDIRAKTPETECHLYPNRGLILQHVRQAGFQQLPKVHFFYVYQKTNRSPLNRAAITNYDRVRYSTPVINLLDGVRSVLKV